MTQNWHECNNHSVKVKKRDVVGNKKFKKSCGKVKEYIRGTTGKNKHFRKSIKSRAKVHDLPNERN